MSDPRGSRKSFVLVLAGAISVVILLAAGAWIVAGAWTETATWIAPYPGEGMDEMFGITLRPRAAAVIAVDKEAIPYARAVRDELIHRGWLKHVALCGPGRTAHGQVDYMIEIAKPKVTRSTNPLRWRRQREIMVSCGVYLPMARYRDDRQVTSIAGRSGSYKIRGESSGYGMPNEAVALPMFARLVVDFSASDLDPSQLTASVTMPPACFGPPLSSAQLADPPPPSGLLPADAWCIADGPGFMLQRQTRWVMIIDPTDKMLWSKLIDKLKANGWRVDPDTRVYGGGSIDLVADRDGQWLTVTVDNPGEPADNAFSQAIASSSSPWNKVCIVRWNQRFDTKQMAAAIDALFAAHHDVDELVQFEGVMNHEQRVKLITLLERSPKPDPWWHMQMVQRYAEVLHDHDKVAAALKQAYALALNTRDVIYLLDQIVPEARKQHVTELTRPPTREQLLAAGAVDLEAGPVTAVVTDRKPDDERAPPPPEKPLPWVGFIRARDHLVLIQLDISSGRTREQIWCDGTISYGPDEIYDPPRQVSKNGWHFTWSYTDINSTQWRLHMQAHRDVKTARPPQAAPTGADRHVPVNNDTPIPDALPRR